MTGAEKKLKLRNWQDGVWFNKPGIGFDVLEEDGKVIQKQFTVTSSRLIRALKPIILKAEDEKREIISVSILRSEEGFNTKYTVRELSGGKKNG